MRILKKKPWEERLAGALVKGIERDLGYAPGKRGLPHLHVIHVQAEWPLNGDSMRVVVELAQR